MKKILLSVAGYDPSSGAGLLLDLKVFGELGFLGMGVLTSITAQNTQRVNKVHCLPPDLLRNQFHTLYEDISFSGIKTGMLGWAKNIKVILDILSESGDIPKIVDPVFKSSSGTWLLNRESIPSFIRNIRGKATVITPNLEEAALISGIKVKDLASMKEAAQRIYELICFPCLLKGGHLKEEAIDLLFDGEEYYFLEKKKLNRNVHGTGCFLSSSLLCYLAKKISLQKACLLATQLTYQAIKKAIPVGRGQFMITFPVLNK